MTTTTTTTNTPATINNNNTQQHTWRSAIVRELPTQNLEDEAATLVVSTSRSVLTYRRAHERTPESRENGQGNGLALPGKGMSTSICNPRSTSCPCPPTKKLQKKGPPKPRRFWGRHWTLRHSLRAPLCCLQSGSTRQGKLPGTWHNSTHSQEMPAVEKQILNLWSPSRTRENIASGRVVLSVGETSKESVQPSYMRPQGSGLGRHNPKSTLHRVHTTTPPTFTYY